MLADDLILQALEEVQQLMESAFEAVSGTPAEGSSLDQAGLIDGGAIIVDYLNHNEAGVALDHLLYMIIEPPLSISLVTFELIAQAAHLLDVPVEQTNRVRPVR